MSQQEFKLLGDVPTGMDLYRFQIFYGLKDVELYELFCINTTIAGNQKQKILGLLGTDKLLPAPLAILLRIYLKHPEFINLQDDFKKIYNIFNSFLSSPKIFPLLFGFNNYRIDQWSKAEKTPLTTPIIKKMFYLLQRIGEINGDYEVAIEELFEIAKQEGLARNVNPFIYGIWDLPTDYKYAQQELEVLNLYDLKSLNVVNFYLPHVYRKNRNLYYSNNLASNDELF